MPKAPTKITAARALYTLDRAMREHLLDRAFGTQHLLRASEYFHQSSIAGCIYCGSPHVERWDHLVSVREGGATVLGNMVPACQPCDDSKGSKDYRAWLSGSARRNPARAKPTLRDEIIQRIEAYQRHFSFAPAADFQSALTPEQRIQYSVFAERLVAFRAELVEFGLVPPTITEEELEGDDDSESNDP
jgi:hypothetical protein